MCYVQSHSGLEVKLHKPPEANLCGSIQRIDQNSVVQKKQSGMWSVPMHQEDENLFGNM